MSGRDNSHFMTRWFHARIPCWYFDIETQPFNFEYKIAPISIVEGETVIKFKACSSLDAGARLKAQGITPIAIYDGKPPKERFEL